MAQPTPAPPTVLAIAGSDSGGGAGIQADLKALAHCGVHGATAITAVTAQSTVGVSSVHAVPPEVIVDQVRAVAGDIGVEAVKVGMLGTRETIEAVARALDLVGDAPVVVDPVMVAESGATLLADDARQALCDLLLPRASVATPNIPEARVLAVHERGAGAAWPEPAPEQRAASAGEPESHRLARAVRALGPTTVVVTGGHSDAAADAFFDGGQVVPVPGARHPDGAAHGSGCTHSSVLAAQLARGLDPLEAARAARAVAGAAVRDGLRGIGSGPGPVDVLGIARRAGTGLP
jgi:hydroxymethylpyrimidine/phosphomethylpyrimidine kinase